jgi:predicted HAD superfamily hydrolase
MLKRVGLSVRYRLFVSSETQKRKDNGEVWKYISQLLAENEKTFIHVGDNVRSDAQLCGDYGLMNIHVLHPQDKWSQSSLPFVAFKDENNQMDERSILKWGQLMANHGRYPFYGE